MTSTEFKECNEIEDLQDWELLTEKLATEISNLEEDNKTIREKLLKNEAEIVDKQELFDQLWGKKESLKTHWKSISDESCNLRTEVERLKKEIQEKETELIDWRRKAEESEQKKSEREKQNEEKEKEHEKMMTALTGRPWNVLIKETDELTERDKRDKATLKRIKATMEQSGNKEETWVLISSEEKSLYEGIKKENVNRNKLIGHFQLYVELLETQLSDFKKRHHVWKQWESLKNRIQEKEAELSECCRVRWPPVSNDDPEIIIKRGGKGSFLPVGNRGYRITMGDGVTRRGNEIMTEEIMELEVLQPQKVSSARIAVAKFDDWLQFQANGETVWSGPYNDWWDPVKRPPGQGELDTLWHQTPDIDFTEHFKKAGKLQLKYRHERTGTGYAYLEVMIRLDTSDINRSLTQQVNRLTAEKAAREKELKEKQMREIAKDSKLESELLAHSPCASLQDQSSFFNRLLDASICSTLELVQRWKAVKGG